VPDPSLVSTAKVHHFVLVTATQDRFDGRTIDIDGQEIDTFSLRKENGRQPAAYLAQVYAEESVIAAGKALPPPKKAKK
jgi:hypothetical protein